MLLIYTFLKDASAFQTLCYQALSAMWMLLFSLATFWLLFVSKLINWEHTKEHNCPSFRRKTSNMTICHPNWNVLEWRSLSSLPKSEICALWNIQFLLWNIYIKCIFFMQSRMMVSLELTWHCLWPTRRQSCCLEARIWALQSGVETQTALLSLLLTLKMLPYLL